MPARVPPEDRVELFTLFAAYFNQDFSDIYGEPEDVLSTFERESTPDELHRAAEEADDLARSFGDEEELRQAMRSLGLGYAPWADGWSAHGWLRHLAERFRT